MTVINVENIKSQMRKGVLEFCVLLILKRRPAYASELLSTLKAANLIVVEGTLYPLLTRMKNAGMLAYKWVESVYGPPRKYYELTEMGTKALDALRNLFADITESVEILSNHAAENTNADGSNNTDI